MNEMDRCMKCMCEQEEGRFCTQCGYDREGRNPERALPVGSVLENKYLIGAVIGEGGFGITYAAWDMLIKTGVAIKEYFPSELVTRDAALAEGNSALDLTLIQGSAGESRYRKGLGRFVEEAKNLAKFQRHPGVVSVKNFFYANNTAYMVMEYIKGITLGTYLKNHGDKLDVEETFRMMEPVMKTLRAIHQEGVIHRDISPDNIMVTEDGQLKLIDFGAARFVGTDDEKSLTVILKHGYAPEEQYRSGGEQGPWTDVYAVSAVIYRMLTGKAPEETFKRMSEKGDSVHEGLKKVPGLSKAAGHALEKGLAVKAEKRFRTMAALYEGIYSGKKRGIWKWGVCAAALTLVSTAALCFAVFGMAGMNKDSEETFAEEEDVREETDDSELMYEDDTDGVADEGGETEEEEELQEPENIRALREYYNANCLGQAGKPIFVDLTGDGNDVMIVGEKRDAESASYIVFDHVIVYRYKNGMVETFDQTSGTGWTYYLYIHGNEAFILKKYINDIYDGWDKTTEIYYEKVSLNNIENGAIDSAEYSDVEMEEMIKESILLFNPFKTGALLWGEDERTIDYKSVMEYKEILEEVTEVAKSEKDTVLDYEAVYDGKDRCIFAVTGKMDGSTEETYIVWALHDGKTEKADMIHMNMIDFSGFDGEWIGKDNIYQFGRAQHYILDFSGTDYKQYKYCYENGTVRKTDDSRYFVKSEKGKIMANISGYPVVVSYDPEWLLMETLTDIFYFENQYVEYGAEVVDISDLEQYENYDEIVREAEGNLRKVKYIDIGQSAVNYEVERAEFDYIRRAENGTYYLNYRVYGKMDESSYSIYGKFDGILKEPDADGYYENNTRAYVVLEAAGNYLEIEGQYIGEKREQSSIGLAVYYGPDKELAPISRSWHELYYLIREESGKEVVTNYYEDFDKDGSYELLAFVTDRGGEIYYSADRGAVDIDGATGCALWFSDGEKTVLVEELADGYSSLSMRALQFGDSLQCSLTRLIPGRYLSVEEILAAGGYATTVFTLEDGIPHVIIKDENICFYEKEDGRGIGCYGPYDNSRAKDSVFYADGNYYWESDNMPIFH